MAKAKIVARVGQEFFGYDKRDSRTWPANFMSIDRANHEEFMLLRALRTIGSRGCVDHPDIVCCKCKAAIDIPVIYNLTGKRSDLLAPQRVTIQECDDVLE